MNRSYDEKRKQVVSELGLEGYDESLQEAMIGILAQNIWQRIQQATTKKLPPEQVPTFVSLLKEGDTKGATALSEKYVPDFQKFRESVRVAEVKKIMEIWEKRDKTKIFPPISTKDTEQE